jgi:hypothetical protein
MAISKAEFSAYIKAFQFRELFNEMGWNNDRAKQPIIIDEILYNVTATAEKSGFRIFICEPPSCNKIPDSATRKKIEGKVTKLFQEHLIIFIDEHKRQQVWQLAVRKAGSPTKISETRFTLSQDPELLYQRASGLFFTLDEEEKVTIIDVTKRVAENFQQNNERVTKKFYEGFKKEHTAFLEFIKGIDDQLNMDWYASLMLNRLMFCYFIQKKGFLDKNKNYLQDKLKACKEKKGKNQFYSFYRDFLLALFHKGLGAPEQRRRGDIGVALEIGKIPYLNGGLFDEHKIEKTFKEISIDDKAFEKLFNFFDEWEWHLDTRESASGKEINPDVIGYIFEKYINDRAQMGAYYTKEDITDYIAKNCIIPWLFDEVKRQYPKAFADDGWLWRMVKTSGNEYIYEAVKYGVPETGGLFDDLPAEIQKGFAPELEEKLVDGTGPWLWELRKSWNKPAPSDIALPTETYREVIERRKRYADIKSKIASGEIKEINDFITYNLNIRQFAQDVIETTDDAEFIRHFYKALLCITILDPTCGSGAFLFAALNILELLYEACIQRMQSFVDEAGKGKHKFFEDTLAQVNAPEHPNLQYFVYKAIILNNLYGVDIMNEAVEIAKLRLFLKLVATVDADYRKSNLGLEPLPDVDFNIRAGNTLVGYATEAQLNEAFVGTQSSMLDFDNDAEKIKEKCDIVARAFARYKEIQLKGNTDFEDFKKAKDDLNDRLGKLRNVLNQLLHKQHHANLKYDHWLATHQPFHWFAEFYEIIHGNGGFDVVIGNPPYVEYTKVKNTYKIINYKTESSGNLYAFIIEKSLAIINKEGYSGMIIPLTSISNNNMKLLRDCLFTVGEVFLSSYEIRPSKLFDGVDQRLTIFLRNSLRRNIHSTGIRRWHSEQRNYLFDYFYYAPSFWEDRVLRLSSFIESSIWRKYKPHPSINAYLSSYSKNNTLSYRTAGARYWIIFLNHPFQTESLSNKTSFFQDKYNSKILCASLNSNLFWWWYSINFDMFNIKDYMIFSFKFDYYENNELNQLSLMLEKDMEKNKILSITNSKTRGEVSTYIYQKKQSKPIIDRIDCLLAQHYGFTHEELDFIINYDIKYRMGKELDNGNEDEKLCVAERL